MSNIATEEKTVKPVDDQADRHSTGTDSVLNDVANGSDRKSSSFSKLKGLIGISGLVMSVALPIGIVPRILNAQELQHAEEQTANLRPAVTLANAKVAPADRLLNLPGAVEAIEETAVYARTNGYVERRFVDIGDRVKMGQPLAHLDTPEIDQSSIEAEAQVLGFVAGKAQSEAQRDRAKADLDRAIAQLSQARAVLIERESDMKFAASSYVRWKKLGEQGAVSLQDVDEKETRLKTASASKTAAGDSVTAAQSEVIAARARLNAEEANIKLSSANVATSRARADRSSTEKSFQNVVSPFSGVITERNVDAGMLVTSGSDTSRTPLYRIARIDIVKVFVDVPQYASSGIRLGQQVSINLKEYPHRTFKGKIARTSVALDPTARTMKTEIHVQNSDLTLSPGMYADVTFSVARSNPVFLIPANSLITSTDGLQVLTVSSDEHAHYKTIKLGEDLGNELEVVSGLTGKERLVINPLDSIKENEAVSVSKPEKVALKPN